MRVCANERFLVLVSLIQARVIREWRIQLIKCIYKVSLLSICGLMTDVGGPSLLWVVLPPE